ncbi:MAG: PIN domain-containing protein [Candidatus Falkowbacteria bacterium]
MSKGKTLEVEKAVRSIVFVDTNVIICPDSVDKLRKGGNLLCISLTSIIELDKLKCRRKISLGVRETIRKIDSLLSTNDPGILIVKQLNFVGLNLDKNNPDHKIIASLNYVLHHFKLKQEPFKDYEKMKMLSNDNLVRILARGIDSGKELIVESYLNNIRGNNNYSSNSSSHRSFYRRNHLKKIANQ